MIRPLLALTTLALLAACGAPAPLSADPGYKPTDGAQVQYHAGRENGMFVMDGVAQGVTRFTATHLRRGRTLRTQEVPVGADARFAFQLGPVENDDQVVLEAPGYRTAFTMTFPWGVN